MHHFCFSFFGQNRSCGTARTRRGANGIVGELIVSAPGYFQEEGGPDLQFGHQDRCPSERRGRGSSLLRSPVPRGWRRSAFLSGGVEFYLFENVGSPSPPLFSFLLTLKTWELDQSSLSSQQSGSGPQDGEEPLPSRLGTAPGAPRVPWVRGRRMMLPGGDVPGRRLRQSPCALCRARPQATQMPSELGALAWNPAIGGSSISGRAAWECAWRNLIP